MKTTTAKEFAEELVEFYGRYGRPKQIFSDRGTQFVNDLISEFCKITGVEWKTSIAYSHQDNAITESVFKEMRRHLKALMMSRKTRRYTVVSITSSCDV
jgi:transposase InsO family protein